MEIEKQEPVEGFVEGEEPLIFYYNRERRIQNAPKNVRDYYEHGLDRPKGFFGVLFYRKGNKLLFAAMLIAFLTVIFMSIFGPKKSEGTLGGVDFKVLAFSFDENVYISLNMKKASKKVDMLELAGKSFIVESRIFDSDGTMISSAKEITKFEKDDTFLRTTFHDYGIIKVECDIKNDEGELLLSAPVEKR